MLVLDNFISCSIPSRNLVIYFVSEPHLQSTHSLGIVFQINALHETIQPQLVITIKHFLIQQQTNYSGPFYEPCFPLILY